jgi:hypothetical protein
MRPQRYGSRRRAVEERVDPLDTFGGLLADIAAEMSPVVNMYRAGLFEDEYPTTPFATPRDRMLSLLEEPEYQRYVDNIASAGMGATTKFGKQVLPKVQRAITPPDDPMIVQHNVRTEALDKIDRMGGLPMPSIAVSKAENPLTNFGDISLLASPEMAKPSAKNPVYSADAYTVRSPSVEVMPTSETLDLVRKMVGEDLNPDHATEIARDLFSGRSISDPAMQNAYLKTKKKGVKRSAFPEGYDGKRAYESEVFKRYRELNPYREPISGESGKVTDYDKWLNRQKNKFLKDGADYTERIFKGFTYSGNRRYAPATLDNIVKEMRSLEKERGSTGVDLSGSMGALRARVTPRFSSLSDVKGSRDKILSNEEFTKAKDAVEQDYNSFVNKVESYVRNIPNYRDGVFGTVDELTSDLVMGRSSKDWFNYDIPEELVTEGRALRSKLRNMPTEYFEIKPKRGVELSEFEGAIIPKDVSKKVKPLLKKAGIRKILEYGSEEERKALFKKFPELMFALPLISAGLLGTEMEMSNTTESLLD